MAHSHVVVLVLGDVGRSPRMQYHSVSFANSPGVSRVSLVGYSGEQPARDVIEHDKIHVVPLKFMYEFKILRVIAILHAVVKGMFLVFSIFFTLLTIPRYNLIIIQNPPCLPAVAAALVISVINGSKIVIDWHNLGFSMFEERLGPKHILVRVARYMEHTIASRCSYHICVSQAMRDWLLANFGVAATVLYDRPAKMFNKSPVPIQARHELFRRLDLTESALFALSSSSAAMSSGASVCSDEGSVYSSSGGTSRAHVEETIQTTHKRLKSRTDYSLRSDSGRAGVIISATSWTPDEDFNILLDALVEVEAYLRSRLFDLKQSDCYSRLVMVITGKGPTKAAFEERVAALTAEGRLNNFVRVVTTWLSFADYALLMRCADLGVCLHTSTSKLDLPMKVYDMLGSGVPVCAIRFDTIGELVQQDRNGLIFDSSRELAWQVIRLMVNPTAEPEDRKKTQPRSPKKRTSGRKAGAAEPQIEEVAATDGTGGFRLTTSTIGSLRATAVDLGNWDDNWNRVMPLLLGPFLRLRSL